MPAKEAANSGEAANHRGIVGLPLRSVRSPSKVM